MSDPSEREMLNYESRVDDRPLSIIPDPRSSWPFLKGILVGTPTTFAALMLVLLVVDPVFRRIPALADLTKDGFMVPAPTHFVGVLVIDVTLKILAVACLARGPFRSSFRSGVLVSFFTSYGSCCGLSALLAQCFEGLRF